jgi:hypothetical protein
MTTKQEIKLNMYLAVKNFADANNSVTKDLPGFAENYSIFLGIIGKIQAIAEVQKKDTKGLAREKNNIKKSLIMIAADYSRKISAFATFKSDTRLLADVDFSETDYLRMTAVALRDYLQILHNKAEEHIEALGPYGITPDMQKTFLDKIIAFNALIASPRTGIVERIVATTTLSELFISADAALEKMDLAMGIIKLTRQDIFTMYTASRKLVETSSGSIALKATATEAGSGKPLRGVTFSFKHDGVQINGRSTNNLILKRTSQMGSFYIKKMDAGTYEVRITKPGFKQLEIKVSVPEKEMCELNVQLEKEGWTSGWVVLINVYPCKSVSIRGLV